MSVSSKLVEIKDYYHIGEWLANAVKEKKELPQTLVSIWNESGEKLEAELENLSNEIESANDQSFKNVTDILKNKGKLAKLKSAHVALELKLTRATEKAGKEVFEQRSELENIPKELDQLLLELEHIQEKKAEEHKAVLNNTTAYANTSLWPGEYKTGIKLFKLFTIAGWVIIFGGIIVALIALVTIQSEFGGFSLLALIPTISWILGGFSMVCFGMIGRSIMENTTNTRQILEIMKNNQTLE